MNYKTKLRVLSKTLPRLRSACACLAAISRIRDLVHRRRVMKLRAFGNYVPRLIEKNQSSERLADLRVTSLAEGKKLTVINERRYPLFLDLRSYQTAVSRTAPRELLSNDVAFRIKIYLLLLLPSRNEHPSAFYLADVRSARPGDADDSRYRRDLPRRAHLHRNTCIPILVTE